jgi:MFS family permease
LPPNTYLTFGIAFLARPVGSFLFGHFGDRIGGSSTLVATMLTMGLATSLIGALPRLRGRRPHRAPRCSRFCGFFKASGSAANEAGRR